MILEDERAAVCDYARRLTADGLVVGTSGNISVRDGALIAVTPTGVDYAGLQPADIPVVSVDGEPVEGELKPTSELPMHLTIYTRAADPDGAPITAVVHTHSVHATAVSTLVDEVPPIHYMLATVGPTARVAPYGTYGTDALAHNMLKALDSRRGCLLANHGTITYGDTLRAAYDRAQQLEWVCRLWLLARSAGAPALLPSEEIEHVVDKLRDYGQR
ncbi:class II aldolase/adducin family protein [Amycolatopsis sp. FDAARGOS 1241]|uniref:class II aldolase/adducin family protein n=1 Tax=Amycolatopsis sp. FDAARGOS 1241 TaxID=2778070 RepID=UPI001950B4AE|nr:class II aldolase/adducin family protein [Amycolatopsis sp. FDAARGOS 1241]QRP46630.1 class II aldolase/adducin family protein [Amycolatopsis sp. FDAARGOS 1241]